MHWKSTIYHLLLRDFFLSIFLAVILQPKSSKNKVMDSTKIPVYRRYKDVCVDAYTNHEQIDKRLLRGRFMLNLEQGIAMFSQNAPTGRRSVEIGRTMHARIIRRQDGSYSCTFRFMHDEEQLKLRLIAEVRDVAKCAELDAKKLEEKARKEAKNGNDNTDD